MFTVILSLPIFKGAKESRTGSNSPAVFLSFTTGGKKRQQKAKWQRERKGGREREKERKGEGEGEGEKDLVEKLYLFMYHSGFLKMGDSYA